MPVDEVQIRAVFQKLNRQLSKLANKPAAANVHKFRTYSRRVEALVEELVPSTKRKDKRLLKLLARLRKKAGRVRDLDVQIAALRSLKLPQEAGRKSQLLRVLADERSAREKKLEKAFGQQQISKLRKGLKRSAARIEMPKSTAELLSRAMRPVLQLGANPSPLTEKRVHQYRIAGKRARYLAEVAGDDPQAKQVVEQLKRMQDVIGDWHDWLKLTERAEEVFDGAHGSALIAALRNITRAKYRQSLDALAETRVALSPRKPVSTEISPPKLPSREADRVATAAA
ncbi:MAG TPA: CHAD domain-containing protein [Terriglobales bacterium]|nr:CHAD domain-containing protein [Terriglobales bacterium]